MFKHFTVDDFRQFEDILNRKINLPDLETLVTSLDEELVALHSGNGGVGGEDYITSLNPRFLCIHGSTIAKAGRPGKYNSFKNWLFASGFPVVADLTILREEYPELEMMSDYQIAHFVYAIRHPRESINLKYQFLKEEDTAKLFIDGYNEYGIEEEFDRPLVTVTKIQYLVQIGRKQQGVNNAS